MNEINPEHYCWFCDKTEICKQDKCDFREKFAVHGYCMAEIEALVEMKHELRKLAINLISGDITHTELAERILKMVNADA